MFLLIHRAPLTVTVTCILQLEEEGEPQVPIPWPSIALAIFLMMFGMTSFVFAWLHFTQEVFGKTQAVSVANN